jgi:hypothetical protein
MASLLLPPESQRPAVDGESATTGRAEATYTRLGGAQPRCEPSITNMLDLAQNAEFDVAAKEHGKIPVSALFPMTHELELEGRIDSVIWAYITNDNDSRQSWKRQFKLYCGVTTRGAYTNSILGGEGAVDPEWDIGIFGIRRNALTPVALLIAQICASVESRATEAKQMFMQYVMTVCLQFYLMERNRFLELSVPADEVFLDRYQPYLFMLMTRYDIKQTACKIAMNYMTADRIAVAAREFDFFSFLFAVLNHVSKKLEQLTSTWSREGRIPAVANRVARERAPASAHSGLAEPADATGFSVHLSDREINDWCQSKLFNNTQLVLNTSKFHVFVVKDYVANLQSSAEQCVNKATFSSSSSSGRNSLVECHIGKYFASPTIGKLITYTFPGKAPLNNTHDVADAPNNKKKNKQTTTPGSDVMRMQSVIPTMYCHFNFTPFRAAFTMPASDEAGASWSFGATTLDEAKSELDQKVRWQNAVFDQISCYIDHAMQDAIQKALNASHRVLVGQIQSLRPGKMQRPTRDPRVPYDSVRSVYAFAATTKQLLCGLTPFMAPPELNLSQRGENRSSVPQWSPLTLSVPAWKHMMKQSCPSDPVQTSGTPPVLELDKGAPLPEEHKVMYDMIRFPSSVARVNAQVDYYLSRILGVNEHTLEHESICLYLSWRDESRASARTSRPNLFVSLYALTLLLQNEAKAARRVAGEEDDDSEQTLSRIKSGYTAMCGGLGEIASIAIAKYQPLRVLCHVQYRQWYNGRQETMALPTASQWTQCFTAETYADLIQGECPDLLDGTWKCFDARKKELSMQKAVQLISRHLSHGRDRFEVPVDWSRSEFRSSLVAMPLGEFIQTEVIDRLHYVYLSMCYAWRICMPASIIRREMRVTSNDLVDLRSSYPAVYSVAQTILRKTNSREFALDMHSMAEGNGGKSEVLTSLMHSLQYFLSHFHQHEDRIQPSAAAASKRKDVLESLRVLCSDVSLERGPRVVHYLCQQAMEKCRCMLTASLALYGKGAFARTIPQLILELSTHFKAKDVLDNIVLLVKHVQVEYQPYVAKFQSDGLDLQRTNPALWTDDQRMIVTLCRKMQAHAVARQKIEDDRAMMLLSHEIGKALEQPEESSAIPSARLDQPASRKRRESEDSGSGCEKGRKQARIA